MKWIPCELHTHTVHSDGIFTVETLAQSAIGSGLECIALTDHNTISGWSHTDKVQRETGLGIIKGLEWTTFYGHMTLMGIESYVDWRDIGFNEIEKAIKRAHQAGGIAGVAHPFRPGNPFCTGCYWQFPLQDWSLVDYYEVWSWPNPHIESTNRRSMSMWKSLLAKGYRITGVCGLDWHRPVKDGDSTAVSYVLTEDDGSMPVEERVVDGIRHGSVCVSIGPPAALRITDAAGNTAGMGGEIVKGITRLTVEIYPDLRKGGWDAGFIPDRVVIESARGFLLEIPLAKCCASAEICLEDEKWIAAMLYRDKMQVGFTNPVYIGSDSSRKRRQL